MTFGRYLKKLLDLNEARDFVSLAELAAELQDPRRRSTAGTGSMIQSGTVRVIPAAGTDTPVAFAIFSFNSGGMTVSEARRLKELEQENGKLKRLLAEAELDKAALKDLLHRKL